VAPAFLLELTENYVTFRVEELNDQEINSRSVRTTPGRNIQFLSYIFSERY
jgi:hypothetical protein